MFVVDCHNDSITYDAEKTSTLISAYNSYPKTHLQVYAMFTEEYGDEVSNFDKNFYNVDNRHDLVYAFVNYYNKRAKELGIVTLLSATDLNENIYKENVKLGFISIEGCGAVGTPEDLQKLYDLGVRFAGMNWNPNNALACGADSTFTENDKGVTEKGIEFLKKAEEIGVVIDVSHASDKTIDDILKNTSRPIYASHSNFREVCGHRRNLRLDHAQEIVKRGGFIGLNLFKSFVLNEDMPYSDYSCNHLLPHIEYADKYGFLNNIGFGFDIDGVDGYPKEANDFKHSIHEAYIEAFKNNGMNNDLIENIAGKNFVNFYNRYGKR